MKFTPPPYDGAKAEFKELERLFARRNFYKFEELYEFFKESILYKYLRKLIIPLLNECIDVLASIEEDRENHDWLNGKLDEPMLSKAEEHLNDLRVFIEFVGDLKRMSLSNRFHQYRSQKVNHLFKYYLETVLKQEEEAIEALEQHMLDSGWEGPQQAWTESDAQQTGFTSEVLESFKTLNIAPTENTKAIQKAWKALCSVWHPDKHASSSDEKRDEAEKMSKAINHAYDVLRRELKKN